MTVDAADPGRGDLWGISAAALQRSVKAITVRAAENSVREAVSEASGEVWAGRARDAFVHTASILADDLGRLASRWDAEASALTAYARGVQAVKDQQQTLTHRRELAEEDIDGWRREQRTAERENLTAMAVGNGAALDDDRPRLLESRISEAEDELALVTRQWGALIDERAATPENGFTELDSGIPGTPAWAQIGKVISPPIAIGDLASGLDHHNQIISGDISENRVVLETINDVIWNAAR